MSKGLQDQPLHLLSNGLAKPTDTGEWRGWGGGQEWSLTCLDSIKQQAGRSPGQHLGRRAQRAWLAGGEALAGLDGPPSSEAASAPVLASSLGYDNSTTAEPSQDASSSPQLGVCSHVMSPPSQLPGDPGSGLTPGQAQVEAPVDLQAGQLLLHPAPAVAAVQSASLQHLQRQPALLVAQQGVVVSASQALAQSAETRAAAGLSSTQLVGAATVHRALPTVPIQGGWRGQPSPGLEHSAWRQRTSTSGSGQVLKAAGATPPLPQHPTPSRTFPLSLVHKLAGGGEIRTPAGPSPPFHHFNGSHFVPEAPGEAKGPPPRRGQPILSPGKQLSSAFLQPPLAVFPGWGCRSQPENGSCLAALKMAL